MNASSEANSELADDGGTAQIKQDIERTRSDLSATVEALETRLKPSEIHHVVSAELAHVEERVRETVKEQLGEAKQLVQAELVEARQVILEGLNDADAKVRRGISDARTAVKEEVTEALSKTKQAVRAATVGKLEDLATNIGDTMNQTRDTLVDTIRQNPIPATMVGAGLLWLLMSRSKTAASAASSARSKVGSAAHQMGSAAHQLTESTTHKLHDASDAVGSAWHEAGEAASDLAHRAGDTAQHWVGDAREATSGAVRSARDGLESASRSVQSSFQSNPLAIGAAALALGAIVGTALPRTVKEDELLGEARDSVLEKAGEVAQQARASVSHLAETALENVKQAAQPSTNANA